MAKHDNFDPFNHLGRVLNQTSVEYNNSAYTPVFENTDDQVDDLRDPFTPGLVLKQESLVNDLVFFINRERRAQKFEVGDRIELHLGTCSEVWWAVYWNLDKLVQSTLTEEIFLNQHSYEFMKENWEQYRIGSATYPFPVFIHVKKTSSTFLSDLKRNNS